MKVFQFLPGFAAAILFVACAMPPRPSYDRASGSYRFSASEKKAEEMTRSATGDAADWMKIVNPWLGTPYKYGKASKSGTDCSGYVMNIYREKTGISLPHSSTQMFQMGKKIGKDDLRTGDLVFFGGGSGVDHVGVYLDNGNFTHASTSRGVMISPLSDSYWQPRYKGARRIQ